MQPAVWSRRLPWSLPAIVVPLISLGLVAICRADDLISGARFARPQAVWAALGMVAMFIATLPNYRVLCRWSYFLYSGSLILLLVVYLFPPVNGAQRWIRVGPLGLQPSEFAKLAFVLALARYLMYREDQRRLAGFCVPMLMSLAPALLILKEPDLGTALVFPPVLLVMLWAAGARSADLLKAVLAGALLLLPLWMQMSREQRSRVTALFEQNHPAERPTGDGYHLHQSKQMLALGGAAGSLINGEAVDDRAVYHLPAARTDFIFSVLGERLGWLGAGGVLLLFCLLVGRSLALADATREPFGRLVAAGIAGLFGVQALINTGMTVGLLPITGLSLPLVSYGGSGLMAHLLAVGLLLNIGMRPGYEIAGGRTS
jgi:rod shape determining protein RodA